MREYRFPLRKKINKWKNKYKCIVLIKTWFVIQIHKHIAVWNRTVKFIDVDKISYLFAISVAENKYWGELRN